MVTIIISPRIMCIFYSYLKLSIIITIIKIGKTVYNKFVFPPQFSHEEVEKTELHSKRSFILMIKALEQGTKLTTVSVTQWPVKREPQLYLWANDQERLDEPTCRSAGPGLPSQSQPRGEVGHTPGHSSPQPHFTCRSEVGHDLQCPPLRKSHNPTHSVSCLLTEGQVME